MVAVWENTNSRFGRSDLHSAFTVSRSHIVPHLADVALNFVGIDSGRHTANGYAPAQ